MYYLHKTTSAVSCVKPNASQWEATLRDDVGFATVYRRIYRCKFLTLPNQTSRYIRECIRITDGATTCDDDEEEEEKDDDLRPAKKLGPDLIEWCW